MALVNTGGTDQELNYVAMTGDGTIGGTRSLYFGCSDLLANSHPDGFTMYYFTGGSHALTKVGANEVDFYNVDTGLGDINIQDGSIYFYGTSSMGSSGAVHVSDGAMLGLWLSTVAHSKPIVIESTAGVIDSYDGDGTINSPITLLGDITVTTEHGSQLTLGGVISDVGGLTADGNGVVLLTGVNSYSGPTHVIAGTLELSATGQISTSSAITNDDTFQIDGGTHALGTIDGTGDMFVFDTAVVSATSIVQGSLQIGGTAPAAASASAVPEPSAWLLLVLGSGLYAMFLRRKAA